MSKQGEAIALRTCSHHGTEESEKENGKTLQGATVLASILLLLSIGQVEAKCYSLPTVRLDISKVELRSVTSALLSEIGSTSSRDRIKANLWQRVVKQREACGKCGRFEATCEKWSISAVENDVGELLDSWRTTVLLGLFVVVVLSILVVTVKSRLRCWIMKWKAVRSGRAGTS